MANNNISKISEVIMKLKIPVTLFLIFTYSMSIIFLTSCNNSTAPEEEQKLIIEDGIFSKVESSDSNEIQYAIQFSYYVKGEECNWGGYHIQMDSLNWTLNLYKMQTLIPNERYEIVDTFKVNNELKSNPIVKMQGYKIGSSEYYEDLYAEYTLILKN